MSYPHHIEDAERALLASDSRDPEHSALFLAEAQVHATLAQAAATDRLAMAVENLPTFEGMLAVYNFGGRS